MVKLLYMNNKTVFKRRSVDCKTFLPDSQGGLAARFCVVMMFVSDVGDCDKVDHVSSG